MADETTTPKKSERQEYLELVSGILAAANNVHKVLMQKRSNLRGAQRKFIANEALDIIIRRLSSHYNIALGGSLVEAKEDDAAIPKPKPIKVPEKLKKKGVDPESSRALAACVRAINKLQDAIYKADNFYMMHTPYLRASQRSAVARALTESIRNLRAERDLLVPPAKESDAVQADAALESFIQKLSEMHDEREYLAVIQRIGDGS